MPSVRYKIRTNSFAKRSRLFGSIQSLNDSYRKECVGPHEFKEQFRLVKSGFAHEQSIHLCRVSGSA